VFDVGDIAQWDFETTVASSRVDATAVTATVTKPDDTTASATVTHVTTGLYSVTYVTTMAGQHSIRIVATGTPARSTGDVFAVRSNSPVAILSLSDARDHLNMEPGDTVDDEELRGFIEAATVAVENYTHEAIARRSVTQVRDVAWGSQVALGVRPVLSVTSIVSTDGTTTWDPDNLDLDNTSGVLSYRTGGLLWGRVVVTFVAGYEVIPANYLLAAKIIVGHLWETQRMPTMGRSAPGFGGEETPWTAEGVRSGYALPNRAVELLGQRPSMVV
jgi:hypothetical protein